MRANGSEQPGLSVNLIFTEVGGVGLDEVEAVFGVLAHEALDEVLDRLALRQRLLYRERQRRFLPTSATAGSQLYSISVRATRHRG